MDNEIELLFFCGDGPAAYNPQTLPFKPANNSIIPFISATHPEKKISNFSAQFSSSSYFPKNISNSELLSG